MAAKTRKTGKRKITAAVAEAQKGPLVFDYAKVERLAGLGLSREKIAIALGCSERTIYNRIREDADFAAAFARGRAAREVIVADKLAENCDKGDTSAIKFYLQAVAGWAEKQQIEMQADVNAKHKVSVKEMSIEQLEAAILKMGGTLPER